MAHFLQQQDGNTSFRKLVQTLAYSTQATVHVLSETQHEILDMVAHGGDFIVAGDGDDLDWLSQKMNEKLELVQKARLGPGYDSEATVCEPLCDIQRLWTHVGS